MVLIPWHLVDQIEKMKGKVVVDTHVKKRFLCQQIGTFTKNLNDVMATNELSIVKNTNPIWKIVLKS